VSNTCHRFPPSRLTKSDAVAGHQENGNRAWQLLLATLFEHATGQVTSLRTRARTFESFGGCRCHLSGSPLGSTGLRQGASRAERRLEIYASKQHGGAASLISKAVFAKAVGTLPDGEMPAV